MARRWFCLSIYFCLLTKALGFFGGWGDNDDGGGDNDLPSITQIAIDNKFTSLVKALQIAGFDDDLNCTSSTRQNFWGWCRRYTVFAPTNDALSSIEGEPLKSILSSDVAMEYVEHLRGLLRYHIVMDDQELVGSTDDESTTSITTVLGETINASVSSDGTDIVINDKTNVPIPNIPASNGLVHVVDSILMPSFLKEDIVDIATSFSPKGSTKSIFSTLVTAVVEAGLEGELRKRGPYTLFAPTDEAFLKLPDGKLQDLLKPENIGELKDILLYHVLSGITRKEDLISGDETRLGTLLENRDIFVSSVGLYHKFVKLNDDAYVKDFDILASNGLVHSISEVLIPPEPLPNIVDLVKSNDNFLTLSAALDKVSGFSQRLSDEGPFTVFAPIDDAFDNLPEDGLLDTLLSNNTALKDVLKYHVLNGEVRLDDLDDGSAFPTLLLGSDITVSVIKFWYWLIGVEINDDAKVISFDIECSNGVVHVIDKVLIPSKPRPTILDIVKSDAENFSTLQKALEATGLDKALGDTDNGPYTVFAPTNAAFANLPPDVLNSLLTPDQEDALTDILLYHVIEGETKLEDLNTGSVQSLQGSEIDVRRKTFFWFWFLGVELNSNSEIVTFDIVAENGIIHVIDNVLIPP